MTLQRGYCPRCGQPYQISDVKRREVDSSIMAGVIVAVLAVFVVGCAAPTGWGGDDESAGPEAPNRVTTAETAEAVIVSIDTSGLRSGLEEYEAFDPEFTYVDIEASDNRVNVVAPRTRTNGTPLTSSGERVCRWCLTLRKLTRMCPCSFQMQMAASWSRQMVARGVNLPLPFDRVLLIIGRVPISSWGRTFPAIQ